MTCTCLYNHTTTGPRSIRLVDARCPVHGDPTGREVLDYVEHANGEITLEYIHKPASKENTS